MVRTAWGTVSPVALRLNPGYLVENKRMVTLIETERFGRVAQLEVGATMVGSILQSYVPGRAVAKGEEKGLFAFGGSCVITLFARGRVVFDRDLTEHSGDLRFEHGRDVELKGISGVQRIYTVIW